MNQTVKENHALTNCRGQLESIKELYRNYLEAESDDDYERQEAIREQAQEEALSVEFKSGWTHDLNDMKPEEFKILLSTGGPACQIVGGLNSYQEPMDHSIEIQYQDWGTPWESLQLNTHYASNSLNITPDHKALEWFCRCYYFGEY